MWFFSYRLFNLFPFAQPCSTAYCDRISTRCDFKGQVNHFLVVKVINLDEFNLHLTGYLNMPVAEPRAGDMPTLVFWWRFGKWMYWYTFHVLICREMGFSSYNSINISDCMAKEKLCVTKRVNCTGLCRLPDAFNTRWCFILVTRQSFNISSHILNIVTFGEMSPMHCKQLLSCALSIEKFVN